jgi:predicted transcriptional regulator
MAIRAQDVVPISEACSRLTDLADEVVAGAEKVLTKNEAPFVAIIDARKLDYYHALEEAHQEAGRLLLLGDAEKALEDALAGRVKSLEEFRRSLVLRNEWRRLRKADLRQMTKLTLTVGTPRDMGDRFIDAWARIEAGEDVNERNVTFPSWDELTAALTPKRLELLRRLHRDGAESIDALAESIDFDYKRVYEDVAAMEDAGLIVREGNRLTAPWDVLTIEIAM